MQTIHTKYVGPTNFRGARIVATASGNDTRISISYDSGLRDEDAHIEGVKALCAKLGWQGKFIGGHAKTGMIWVFDELLSPRFEVRK